MSGSLQFPPSPTPGTTHGAWIFDARGFWVVNATSGQGVTDGSDAAPGEVGERLVFNQATSVPFATAWTVIHATTHGSVVPPGDWDLSASVSAQGTGMTINGVWAVVGDQSGSMSPTRGFAGGRLEGLSTVNGIVEFPLSTAGTFSFADPMPIFFVVWIFGSGGSPNVAGQINLRRAR